VTSLNNTASPKTAQMACPAGKRLIGGGARLNGGGTAVALQQSFPDNDNVFRAQGREVVATNAVWSLTVYAVCAATS
jgi:hypothetical protein